LLSLSKYRSMVAEPAVGEFTVSEPAELSKYRSMVAEPVEAWLFARADFNGSNVEKV